MPVISWNECYPRRKRGSEGYTGSTDTRAGCGPEARAPRPAGRWAVICTLKRSADTRVGCGPEARAPRPAGRWAVICTPKRATDTRAARGPAARALRCGGNSMSDWENEALIDQRANAIRIALQRIVLLRETGPKSAAWQRARIKTMWRLQQQLTADTKQRQVNDYDE